MDGRTAIAAEKNQAVHRKPACAVFQIENTIAVLGDRYRSSHEMMPANDLKEKFRDAFMTVIATHDTAIRNALKSILTTSIPPDVKILLFETQSDWSKIPIVVFSMDNESPDETYYEEPFSGFLVNDGDELIPDGRIDQDHYEDNGIDTYDLTHDLLAEWISAIWGELGGRQFSIPAYIGGHDRDAFIDLRTEAKCSSVDIWPE